MLYEVITDVEYLGSQLPYLHINPYFKTSESKFQQSVTDLANQVPNLNDEQIIVEIVITSYSIHYTKLYEADKISGEIPAAKYNSPTQENTP